MEDAPRPRIFHKKKDGKREKIATTIDSVIFELIKEKQQQGQQLSHILGACWVTLYLFSELRYTTIS